MQYIENFVIIDMKNDKQSIMNTLSNIEESTYRLPGENDLDIVDSIVHLRLKEYVIEVGFNANKAEFIRYIFPNSENIDKHLSSLVSEYGGIDQFNNLSDVTKIIPSGEFLYSENKRDNIGVTYLTQKNIIQFNSLI